ncbi:unnamed protein product [Heligmosomoides polygyrus]|uniref:Nuclear cap-binding protein subunit 2 n=1 Tax=Heligmosomoides polygyrus TaxID=6339 RepID=A0A183GHJ7_HELPZ|nr:unnamed protein product [Heligmosomoides polygyrus]
MPAYWDCRFKGDIKDQEEALRVSTTVYVGNLSYYVTEDQLHELFGRVGEVKRVVMGIHRFKKTPCGFCFVMWVFRSRVVHHLVFGARRTTNPCPQWCISVVRDEYRDKYDPDRGGFGQMVNMTGNTNNAC